MAIVDRMGSTGSGRSGEASRAAFDRCFDAHYPQVLAFAARRVEGPAEAEDVLAETFAVAWRRRHSMPDPSLPWLYGVARRVIANQRRAVRRADRLASKLAAEPHETATDPGDLVPGRMSVLAAFAELSERDREILRLIAWEGLNTAEGAVVLGCSRTAFRVRLHRARGRLAKRLDADDDAAFNQLGPNHAPQEVR